MNKSLKLGSLLVLLGILGLALGYAIITNLAIPNVGNVKTVGVQVYWDQAKTDPCTLINWGFVDPGFSYNKTVYVYNPGNTNATLTMTVNNWNPAVAETYLTVTWNRQGTVLEAYLLTSATITLTVNPTVTNVTNFNFDLVFTGTT